MKQIQPLPEMTEKTLVEPPKQNQHITPNYGHFAPLILTLVALRTQQAIFTPLAQPVVTQVLRYVPHLLNRTGYATMLVYLKAAQAKGFIKISGDAAERAITLADEHAGADANELMKQVAAS
jgi:hypothetical protein